ncbi:MAG: N-acetylneuraminate synthase family protein, partial [Bdellovibrionales bacterium]|nr:N-acetylneuraminate synthase family protein [Bdellovibrionales bacterium]
MSSRTVMIGGHEIGDGKPCFVIGEIGLNHNGDVEIAKKLIDVASIAGCNAVKFQKRTPELCVPPEQRNIRRETPWGEMTYLEYRYKVEFNEEQYRAIDLYAKSKKMVWFASPWDPVSVDFLEKFNPPCYKVASASITDLEMLRRIRDTKRPVIISTGMSTMQEIHKAVEVLGTDKLLIAHATSAYPCKPEELNLRMIATLKKEFDCPIGYSGHEVGLQATIA